MTSKLTDETQRGAAVSYIWDQLSNGKTLARLLLKHVDFKTGTVAILNAVSLDAKQMLEFNWGHVPRSEESARWIKIEGQFFLGYPVKTANDQLVELIYTSLEGPEDLCLLEHSLASPGDPWLKRAKSRVATHSTDVYLILDFADRNRERIEDARSHAECLPVFVGAIGRQPPLPITRDSGHLNISTEQLQAFAKSVHCVFVGAYDGEGYVIWEARRSKAGCRIWRQPRRLG